MFIKRKWCSNVLELALAAVILLFDRTMLQLGVHTGTTLLEERVTRIVDKVQRKEHNEQSNRNSNVVHRCNRTLTPSQERVHPRSSLKNGRDIRNYCTQTTNKEVYIEPRAK